MTGGRDTKDFAYLIEALNPWLGCDGVEGPLHSWPPTERFTEFSPPLQQQQFPCQYFLFDPHTLKVMMLPHERTTGRQERGTKAY